MSSSIDYLPLSLPYTKSQLFEKLRSHNWALFQLSEQCWNMNYSSMLSFGGAGITNGNILIKKFEFDWLSSGGGWVLGLWHRFG